MSSSYLSLHDILKQTEEMKHKDAASNQEQESKLIVYKVMKPSESE